LIAAGTSDATKIWDVDSGQVVQQLYGRNSTVYALALSSDGSTIATGGENQVVQVWR
jgi:WD40 repeat protein